MAVRVAAVGEICEDLYLPEREGFLGGISVNFARAATVAGAEAAVFGPVGSDERGARLHDWLSKAPIATRRVRRLAGSSACQQIRVAPDGERVFCGFEAGVLFDYQLDTAELRTLDSYDRVAVPCSPESRRVFRQCVEAGLGPKLVADLSQDSPEGEEDDPVAWLSPHLDRLAVAFVGGRADHVEALRGLSASSDIPIVLTAGAAGAYALVRGRVLHQPSLATEVVDTTGCGDAFQAGFVVHRAMGRSLADALEAGARLAAQVASHRGAAP
jgi:fructoselysine 6-kinase